jgi:predicted outer membrane repeat protein
MRRPLVVLLTLVAFGCLAGAVQALGIAALPLVSSAAQTSGGGGDDGARAGVPVRAGRVVVDARADRPDVRPGDGRCADARGACTLRAAVMEANAGKGLTHVVLPRGTYVLRLRGAGEDRARRGDLDVRRSLTVEGRGRVTVGGGRRDRVFDVARGVRLELRRLAVVGGAPPAGESGGAIRSAGRLLLTGAKVAKSAVRGDGTSGGGVFNDGGTVLARDAQVNRNSAPGGGGAIASDGGTVLLRDSRLLVNSAGTGGAVRLALDATADLRDSALERNRSTGAGGGAVEVAGGRLAVLRGSLSGNEAAGAGVGGAIRNDGGAVRVDGAELLRNGAGAGGGAVAAVGGETTVTQTQVKGNAAADGGGLDVAGGTATVDAVVLEGNRVSGAGGAVRVRSGGALALSGSSYLVDNLAAGAGGGAISNDGGRVTVDGGVLGGNAADGSGGAGGALRNVSGTVELRGADVSRNRAARAGGALAVAGGSVAVANATVDENSAALGGGLHLSGGTVTLGGDRGSRLSGNRASVRGGALWVGAGVLRAPRANLLSNVAPQSRRAWVAPGARATLGGEPIG